MKNVYTPSAWTKPSKIKILGWKKNGFCLWQKRLDRHEHDDTTDSALHRRKYSGLARRRLLVSSLSDLAGMRDSGCDLCDEFRLGKESRRVRGSHRLPIGTRTTGRLDLSPDAGRTGFFSQDRWGAVSRMYFCA